VIEQVGHNTVISVKTCFLVQALRLCTGRTAYRWSRGIALLFLDHGTRKGWGVSVTPRPLFIPRKDTLPIGQKAGWAPGLVGKGAGNLAPTGIRSPDRPARSQSLYRLRYPALTVISVHIGSLLSLKSLHNQFVTVRGKSQKVLGFGVSTGLWLTNSLLFSPILIFIDKSIALSKHLFDLRHRSEVLQSENSFTLWWNLDTSESRSEVPGKFWNVLLEKDGEEQPDQPCEKRKSITHCQEGQDYTTYSKQKASKKGIKHN
jgi:hypothetical protein